MYRGLFEILKTIQWEDRGYRLLEFGCLEPTSSIIRMLVYLMGDRLLPSVCDYPETDIQKMNDGNDTWDILVVDQVLEHVEKPWMAACEIYRTLRPGGIAIVNTPYLHPIHKCPLDCWRISPDGYRVLFPDNWFEVVGNGMWGNRAIVEEVYHSTRSRGMTGDWIPVSMAEQEIPSWNTPTDNLNPIVIFNVFRKR